MTELRKALPTEAEADADRWRAAEELSRTTPELERLEERARELAERRKELQRAEADAERADRERLRVAELESEVEALERRLEQRRGARKGTDMDPTEALEVVAKAVGNAGADHAALRKRAEDLYQERVEEIAERDGCGASEAHAKASGDGLARRAYALAAECREREAFEKDAASRLKSYLG